MIPTHVAQKLLHASSRIYHSRLIRVLAFGGVGVLTQTAVFETGIWVWALRPSLATLIGAECGVLVSFFLNNKFSFAHQAHHSLVRRILRYHVVISGSLCIQWLSVFMTESVSQNIWLIHGAYLLGIIVGFVFNYTGYRMFVWHPKG